MQNIHSYRIPTGASDDPESILSADKDYQNGKAVYTSIRTYAGKPFCLDQHLIRLKQSAKLLGFEILYPIEQIRGIINQLIQDVSDQDQFLRITATPKNLVFITRPLEIDESIYEGVSVVTADLQRIKVRAKTFANKEMIQAYEEAAVAGHHDVLLLNEEGNITEGTRSNFLWIKDETLYWCPDALFGITQVEVFRCAKALYKEGSLKYIQEAPKGLSLDEITKVDEIFVTQTSRGIVPVIRVNDVIIGDGKIGPKTKALRQQFHKHILEFAA